MGFVVVLLLPEKVKLFDPLELSQNRFFGSVKFCDFSVFFRRTVEIQGIPTDFFLGNSILTIAKAQNSKTVNVTFSMAYMGGIEPKKVL